MCSHLDTVTTEYSIICRCCGLERPVVINTMDYPQSLSSAPLNRLYNRCDRWCSIVKKVTGIHTGPAPTDPIWAFLEKHKATFTCPTDISAALAKSGLKNKHYPCIHTFTRMFASGYKAPRTKPNTVLANMEVYFKHILHLWNTAKLPDDQFFSYNWLLEQGLCLYGYAGYLPYVKKLKCITRRQRYVTLLLRLYETRAGRPSRVQLGNHSRNERCPEVNPRSRSPTLRHLVQQNVASRRSAFEAGSLLDRLYKRAVSLGTPGTS